MIQCYFYRIIIVTHPVYCYEARGVGLTLCCGKREKAGGRKEMGVSAMVEVIWEACGVRGGSTELEKEERAAADVWYDMRGIEGMKEARDEKRGVEECEGRRGMEGIDGARERRGMEAWLLVDRGEATGAGMEKTEDRDTLPSLKESSISCTVIPDITMAEMSFSTAFPPALSSSRSFFTSPSFFRGPARTTMEFAVLLPEGTEDEGDIRDPDAVYLEIVSKLNL